jgi:hypothetical protein
MALIQNAFGKLPHYLKLQQGRATYCDDTGGANALRGQPRLRPALFAGLELTVKVAVSNSGAATLNVNGLGAKAIISGRRLGARRQRSRRGQHYQARLRRHGIPADRRLGSRDCGSSDVGGE